MGKGGGCVPSKKRPPAVTTTITPPPATITSPGPTFDEQISLTITSIAKVTKNLRVLIVFYSIDGHVETLARRIKTGFVTVEGVFYRVPETLSDDVLGKMRPPPKDDEIGEMVNADGFLFGFPTRYGAMAAQMEEFFIRLGVVETTETCWAFHSTYRSRPRKMTDQGHIDE